MRSAAPVRMYECGLDEYATAWTGPVWPVSLAMGFVGKDDMVDVIQGILE